jgi:S1-C subfamily serine protease
MGFRAAVLAAALLLDLTAQPLGVVRIKVTIVDADGIARPVPRHALLISENPSSSAPRRVITTLDGTAEISLRPANYTIESDEPLIFQGKAYQWAQTLDVAAGRTTPLEFNAGNAQVEAAAAVAPAVSSPSGSAANASALLLDWQASVVSIWSPTKLGAGFLIDARGFIATNQRLVGAARSLEVQLSPTEKVAARVLASDPDKNVAILWIDPKAVASARPMKLAYADQGPAPADKDKLFSITATIHDGKHLASGIVSRVTSLAILSDIRIDDDTLGAPLFNAAGEVVAISTAEDETSGARSSATRAVRIDQARSVIAAAEKKMQTTEAPSPTRLPVEPPRPLDDEALKAEAKRRAGSLAPYAVKGADFDVSLITPVLVYGARHPPERAPARDRGRSESDPAAAQTALAALEDFANWEDYVRDAPPVFMIRATPKLVESLWKTIARGAAQTQGIAIPAIKSIKAGFSRMQVFCGAAEVTPIHPFKIERRVGANNAVYEGLYVFDPGAIGPHCGTVKLTLFSDKNPTTGDTRVIDPKIVQQIWQDFAPYRAGA